LGNDNILRVSDFFDSSVLIGVIHADCIEHTACAWAWNKSAARIIYGHALLETFSQLTGGRLGIAVPPDMAIEAITRNVSSSQVDIIDFPAKETLRLLKQAGHFGARGGAVYDYMHLCAARKAGAERIFTLNKRHFIALAPDLISRIRHPSNLL